MKPLILLLLVSTAFAYGPDWSADADLGKDSEFRNRENIYSLPQEIFNSTIIEGYKHALIYPVETTELLIPVGPLKYFFGTSQKDPIRRYVFKYLKKVSAFSSFDQMLQWLGLHEYPKYSDQRSPNFPDMPNAVTQYPMGTTMMKRRTAKGITFSCAACHSGNLFGKKILGLTNRFPKANNFFHMGKKGMQLTNTHLFKLGLKATEDERLMLRRTQSAMKWVGTKKPQAIGLDTTLAQISLSLSKRGSDEYATKYIQTALLPRSTPLSTVRADSKPAVWWNAKYKTKWLSDGSIISGNPVLLNFLWNEIGRGADLKKLEVWAKNNKKKIMELTTALFSTQAPKYTDFFDASSINIEKAKRGEKIFVKSCKGCHGTYKKGWSEADNNELNRAELIQTTEVIYHAKTPIKNVGTDPLRAQGIKYLEKRLNSLAISKWMGMTVKEQKGYVPQPLVGIWARWPYFHNNSIPNLCSLMTPPKERPKKYWSGEAINKYEDFDSECVGYPLGDKTPRGWKVNPEYLYDTTKQGLSNSGHYYKIFTTKDGVEKFNWEQKLSLIEFLKTL